MNSQSAERKLTTIMSADVVGYSAMMSRDEIGTLAELKKIRRTLIKPKTKQYKGRSIKLMGDGELMEFGSVVDALRYSIEVQCAMEERNAQLSEAEKMCFRIGVNIGDIIVDGDDIYGDGVNIAARLEALADPGGVCLSRTVFNHVKGKLDVNFDDLGERHVKNIPHPISVYRVCFDDKTRALVTPIEFATTPTKSRFKGLVVSAALVLALLLATLLWWEPWETRLTPALVERMSLPLPDRPSIAVLPFDNFSEDPSQEYFADGITEDLITDLSKLSGIFVISRNSTWSYKNQTTKPQEVAEDLGVRYVLEGSVRREGNQVRVNAQLIDAIGGQHLWAERYDGSLGDVFKLQDEIITKIVAALAVNLTSTSQTGVEQAETGDPRAYDALLQGLDHLRRDTEEGTLNSIALFEKAIEIDANYGRAYAALATAHWRIVVSSWFSAAGGGFSRSWNSLNQNLEKAIEADTALGHAVAAEVFAQQGRFDEAFDQINRAMAIAPNESDNYISKAKILNALGRANEAEEAISWAMRLNPRYSPEYLRVLARSLFHQERYEEAADALKRVLSQQSDVIEDYATLASSFGHLGRNDEVPAMIEKYNELAIPSGYDAITVQEHGMWWYGDIFDYDDTYRTRLQEGLRKAGITEGAGTDLSRDDYVKFISKNDGVYDVDGATKIDAASAKELFDSGSVRFIDVRAKVDHGWGHVPGSINLSLITELSKRNLLAVIDIDDGAVFYCHGEHCPYSAYASAKALAWGFSRVYYLAGGFPAWNDAGYPVEAVSAE